MCSSGGQRVSALSPYEANDAVPLDIRNETVAPLCACNVCVPVHVGCRGRRGAKAKIITIFARNNSILCGVECFGFSVVIHLRLFTFPFRTPESLRGARFANSHSHVK